MRVVFGRVDVEMVSLFLLPFLLCQVLEDERVLFALPGNNGFIGRRLSLPVLVHILHDVANIAFGEDAGGLREGPERGEGLGAESGAT